MATASSPPPQQRLSHMSRPFGIACGLLASAERRERVLGGWSCCLLQSLSSPSTSQCWLSHMPRPFGVACRSLASSGRGRGGSSKGGRVAAAATARRQRQHHGGGIIPLSFPAPAKSHAEAFRRRMWISSQYWWDWGRRWSGAEDGRDGWERGCSCWLILGQQKNEVVCNGIEGPTTL